MSDGKDRVTIRARAAVHTSTPTEEEAAAARVLGEQAWAKVLATPEQVVDEWRVVGDVGPGYPVYDFTWRGEDAEAAARRFLAAEGIAQARTESRYALRLYHRTYTLPPWTEAAH